MYEFLPVAVRDIDEAEDDRAASLSVALRLAALTSVPTVLPAPVSRPAASPVDDWRVVSPPFTAAPAAVRDPWLEAIRPIAHVARSDDAATDEAALEEPARERHESAVPVTSTVAAAPTWRVAASRTRAGAVVRMLAAALVAVSVVALPPLEDLAGPDALTVSSAQTRLEPATFAVPPLESYAATFETESAFPTVRAGGEVEWVVGLRNTGSAGWHRGVDGAQASLKLADGTVAAVQTTPFVGPGQVGWFVTRFRAPSDPGSHVVNLFPHIDGRGPLADLGLYAVVTVAR